MKPPRFFKCLLLVALALLLFPLCVDSQEAYSPVNQEPSLQVHQDPSVLIQRALELQREEPDSAIQLLEQAVVLSKERQDGFCEEEALMHLGGTQGYTGHFADALLSYERAGRLSRFSADEGTLAFLYASTAAFELINYDRAIYYAYRAKDAARSLGSDELEGVALCQLSNVYFGLGLIEQQINILRRATALFKASGDRKSLSISYLNLGVAFTEKTHHSAQWADSARHYSNLAKNLFIERKDTARIRIVWGNLGDLAMLSGDYNQAINLQHKALQGQQAGPGAYSHILRRHCALLACHAELNRPDSVEYYFQLINPQFKHIVNVPDRILADKTLSRYFNFINELQKAYPYLEESSRLMDSLSQASREAIIVDYDLRLRNEKASRANELLLIQVKQKNNQLVISGVILFLLLVLLTLSIVFVVRFQQISRGLRRSHRKQVEITDQLTSALEELNETQQMRELMLGTIVHDLKNPLNAVIGLSGLPPNIRSQDVIHRAGRKMLQQVNDLLDVQRLESNQMELKPKEIRADELVKAALDSVAFEYEVRELSVLQHCPKDLSVICDANLIERVLVNLLTNAIKFSPQGASIQIGVETDGAGVSFWVSDSGPGVPLELQEQIFNRFVTIEPKDLGHNRSSGLGLTFCKMAVEAHGGRIEARSLPAGGEFRFWLP